MARNTCSCARPCGVSMHTQHSCTLIHAEPVASAGGCKGREGDGARERAEGGKQDRRAPGAATCPTPTPTPDSALPHCYEWDQPRLPARHRCLSPLAPAHPCRRLRVLAPPRACHRRLQRPEQPWRPWHSPCPCCVSARALGSLTSGLSPRGLPPHRHQSISALGCRIQGGVLGGPGGSTGPSHG